MTDRACATFEAGMISGKFDHGSLNADEVLVGCC